MKIPDWTTILNMLHSCRDWLSPDPYIAAASDIRPVQGRESKSKFEEDIGAPWWSRFSRSATIEISNQEVLSDTHAKLVDAMKLFPSFAEIRRDGVPLNGELHLQPVNSLHAYETIFDDAKLVFVDADNEQNRRVI